MHYSSVQIHLFILSFKEHLSAKVVPAIKEWGIMSGKIQGVLTLLLYTYLLSIHMENPLWTSYILRVYFQVP